MSVSIAAEVTHDSEEEVGIESVQRRHYGQEIVLDCHRGRRNKDARTSESSRRGERAVSNDVTTQLVTDDDGDDRRRQRRQRSARLLHARAQHPLALQARPSALSPVILHPAARQAADAVLQSSVLLFRIQGQSAYGCHPVSCCTCCHWSGYVGVSFWGTRSQRDACFPGGEQVSRPRLPPKLSMNESSQTAYCPVDRSGWCSFYIVHRSPRG